MQGTARGKVPFDIPCTENNMESLIVRIIKQNQNYKGVFDSHYNLKVMFCVIVVPVASDTFQGPEPSPRACGARVPTPKLLSDGLAAARAWHTGA